MSNNFDNITTAWQQYEDGKAYNYKLGLYETVNRNNRFYSGDQWSGLTMNGLPMPIFNIFKRVANYKIASIMSQKIKMQYSPENVETDTQDPEQLELKQKAELLSKNSEIKWEKLKMDSLIREGLLDGFNSGDIAFYTYWDSSIDTKQTYGSKPKVDDMEQPMLDEMGQPIIEQVPIMGDFCTELIDGVNVMFGNPNNRKTKGQPYILIPGRAMVSDLKEEARKNGISESDINQIVSDSDNQNQAGDKSKIELDNVKLDDGGKCSYLIKLRMDKKTKTVWFSKSTKYVEIQKERDMKIRKYPLDWTNWDTVKNCYHGQAESTGLIQNQILINKMYAMVCKWCMDMAFGKVAYDATKISGWTNAIGVAVPVQGETTGAVQQLNAGQMNTIVVTILDKIVELTLEMMGATDTALGNAAPDNYKALVANQQQANIPLENVKANVYQLVEDIGLTWLEFELVNYDVPRKLPYKEKDKLMMEEFEGTKYKDANWGIKIDVGPSSYWSELASVETLSNLLKEGKITDIQYFERLPNGYIIDKEGIVADIKKRIEQEQMMQQQQDQMMQDEQIQGEQMKNEQMQMEQQQKESEYEQMASFMEQLPPQVQQQLQQLSPDMMEQQLMKLMQQSVGQAMKNNMT